MSMWRNEQDDKDRENDGDKPPKREGDGSGFRERREGGSGGDREGSGGYRERREGGGGFGGQGGGGFRERRDDSWRDRPQGFGGQGGGGFRERRDDSWRDRPPQGFGGGGGFRDRREGGGYGGDRREGGFGGERRDFRDQQPPREINESVFSKKLRAGKRRTYFFDVQRTRGEDFFITLTESTRKMNGFGYERHKMFLYKEDFNRFIESLQEVIDHVKTELMPDFDYDEFARRQAEWEAQNRETDQDDGASEPPAEDDSKPKSEKSNDEEWG